MKTWSVCELERVLCRIIWTYFLGLIVLKLLQAHPHARAYRMKTFPNYRDLELIFKNGSDDVTSNFHQEKNLEDIISETNAGE